ncbi:tyrosine-type recombinase/integrase [Timonella sp. A28]|uniref:tyrosine-type recombinase/integrase n=1 Tax=Timonella sp. A28 TaxID=3442640 RepID=UPI003EC0E751
MPKKRSPGDGGLWYNESKGLWIAAVDDGFHPDGRRRQKYVSSKSQAKARAKLKEVKAQIAKYGTTLTTEQTKTTVREWSEQWLKDQETRQAPGSFSTTRATVRKWIQPTIGHIKIHLVRPPHIKQVYTVMEEAGRTAGTINRARAVMSSMFKAAITDGGHEISENIFKVSPPAGIKNTLKRDAISVEDALKILHTALNPPAPIAPGAEGYSAELEAAKAKARTIDPSRFVAAILQGARPAEARGYSWELIDFENSTIDISWQLKPLPYKKAYDRSSGFRVPRGFESIHLIDSYHLVRPKTDSGDRFIPMVPWLHASLLDLKNKQGRSPHGLVWTRHNGRPLTDKEDRAAWKALCFVADVPEVDLYNARHTTATLLRMAGVDDETIIAIMGHSSILSTKAYIHTDIERAREALMRVAKTLQLEN